jgi:hypothetical protein
MNKLLIGLLIIAAGVGAFFYFRNKKQSSTENSIQKELLVGKWKMESIQTGKDSSNSFLVGMMGTVDSNLLKYGYEFTKDGNIFRSIGDSITKDSSRYEWNKKDQLVWKDNFKDSVALPYKFLRLPKTVCKCKAPIVLSCFLLNRSSY